MTDSEHLATSMEAMSSRLDALEARLAAVDDDGRQTKHLLHVTNQLETANHALSTLEPRFEALELAFAELQRTLEDVDKMAAEIWDRVAITRRLAMIEDALVAGPAPNQPEGAG